MPAVPRIALIVAVSIGTLAGGLAPALSASNGDDEDRNTPAVSRRVLDFALAADGEVVRRTAGATVERILLPAGLRSATTAETVWSVEIEGRFPARALRYVVSAGDEDIGYGIPTGDGSAVRTVTSDPSVLSERLSAVYEGGPSKIYSRRRSAAPVGPSRVGSAAGGPYEVSRSVYNLGAQVFKLSKVERKVELVGDVHYPTELSEGPFPLVLFMAGNHATCYRNRKVKSAWPCPQGWKPLPNHTGYDYIARDLASHGSVVASISANGVNFVTGRLRRAGMRQRGELIDKHLDLWQKWTTTGGRPFGQTFVGGLDMERIGTMGHSRGGEGVVWHKIVDEEQADPHEVDAVMAIAPIDITRATINNVPFAVVLPTCDGDVSDHQGVHFFDDSRYAVPGDPTPKHTLTSFGANHNFFNTVWTPSNRYPGGSNDGRFAPCRNQLTAAEQRRAGRAYVVKFFRRYLLDEDSLDPLWTGARAPWSVGAANALVSYLAPDLPTTRKDLSRFVAEDELFTNYLGGTVTPRRLSHYGWCANDEDPCGSRFGDLNDIHFPGLAQAELTWRNPRGRLVYEIPEAHSDLSSFQAFQLRARTNPSKLANEGIRFQDFVVELVDGEGNRASVSASEVGNEALANPSAPPYPLPIMVNQIRFPLRLFEGIDLADVALVRLRFSEKETGAINLADVAFTTRP